MRNNTKIYMWNHHHVYYIFGQLDPVLIKAHGVFVMKTFYIHMSMILGSGLLMHLNVVVVLF